MEWVTAGGFARHILFYNINPYSIALLRIAWHQIGGVYAMLFLSAIGALVFLWRQDFTTPERLTSLGPSNARRVLAVVTLWLGFAALMTVTVGKEGSHINYFIELLCVCVIPVAMMAAITWHQNPIEPRCGRRWRRPRDGVVFDNSAFGATGGR